MRGPWVRACCIIQRRCFGGRRRQTSQAVSATPTGPSRRVTRRPMPPLCPFSVPAVPVAVPVAVAVVAVAIAIAVVPVPVAVVSVPVAAVVCAVVLPVVVLVVFRGWGWRRDRRGRDHRHGR